VIYSYGLESAYFKYSATLEIGTKQQNFTTPFISLFSTSIFFSLFISAFALPIGGALAVPVSYGSIIYWSAAMLALDGIAIIPFASLRMEHKAGLFASIKFLSIFINVVLNLVLLLVFRMGVEGVFISGTIASASALIMLLPIIFKNIVPGINAPLLKELLRFGLPYIPSGLAAMAIQVIDRPILRALTDEATVGIYQANYRLGIFMMLIVSMYEYAWRPFYFSTAKDPNAKQIFARVLTYLVLFMAFVFLVLTYFIDDIAKMSLFGRHIIGPGYWSGLGIVPIVLLGYLFLGISTNFSAGIYIEKKTQYTPFITITGALVNIIVNFLLIPKYGMFGAAWATLAAYAVMALVSYLFVRNIYPINYEWNRIFKIAVGTLLCVCLYYVISVDSTSFPVLSFGWRILLLVVFAGVMYFSKFFKREEAHAIRDVIMKARRMNSRRNNEHGPVD
jgi:O-antigen/teichoic acid export membrane protein